MTEPEGPNLATATAHRAWDARWQDASGREEYLTAEPDVAAVIPQLKERGARRTLDLGCGVGRHVRLFEGFELLSLGGRLHHPPDHWHWHLLAEYRAIA